jgi:hypothetical protein
MGNVVGEPLEEYVIQQIKARQKLHGAGTFSGDGKIGGYRTENQLDILNASTSWIKLASGVSIEDFRLKEIGLASSFKGMGLAKNFVLFGGTSNFFDDKLHNRNGFLTIEDNPSSQMMSTYTQGEFGYSPMPGIVSANIKTLNRGSIKKSTVRLKAHNKQQFAIIDLLYLRLGYTVLLEWGNTMYTSDGNQRELVMNSLLEDKFFKSAGKSSYLEFLGGTDSNTIAGYRRNYDGNYDGILGKISNFNWSFQPDGSYDIELTIISLGDVIESLKTNISVDKSITTLFTSKKNTEDSIEDPIEENKDSNAVANMLWLFRYFDDTSLNRGGQGGDITIKPAGGTNKTVGYFLNVNNSDITTGYNYEYKYAIIDGNGTITEDSLKISGKDSDNRADTKLIALWNNNFNNIKYCTKKNITKSSGIAAISFFYDKKTYTVSYTKINLGTAETTVNPLSNAGYWDAFRLKTPTNQYYIRFKFLLDYIQDNIISKIDTNKSNHSDNPSIIKMDTGENTNYMYSVPNHISLDPRVCIVKNNQFQKPFGIAEVYSELKDFTATDSGEDNPNPNIAYPMNIYLNFRFVIDSLNSNMDEKGDVNLYNFISSICTGINKALGSVNNLEPVIDEDTNTIKIIDTTPIPGAANPLSDQDQYSIQLYGYEKKNNFYESTFVRKVDLKTAITPEYATMVTVGATADGYVKGTEATAFSRWNKGLTDRFNDKLLPGNAASLSAGGIDEAQDNYIEKFLGKVIECYGFPGNLNSATPDIKDLSDDIIENNLSVVSEYYKYAISTDKTKSGGTVGFVPFKLNLTMDGISGIKIYNKLEVDTSFMPSNYGKTLEFIVTGVSHNLQGNDWETEIETTVIPKTSEGKNPLVFPSPPIQDVTSNVSTCTDIPSRPIPKGIIKPATTSFESLFKIMVDNIEGGYFHPTHAFTYNKFTKKSELSQGFKSMFTSGETLWGIDRVNGAWEVFTLSRPTRTTNGIAFWDAVDKQSGFGKYKPQNQTKEPNLWNIQKYPKISTGWGYNKGPKSSSMLFKFASKMMEDEFMYYMDKYFKSSTTIKQLILNDGRLKFMFMRSLWAGIGRMETDANGFIKIYNSGERDIEKLICRELTRRWNSSSNEVRRSNVSSQKTLIGI